MIITAAHGSGGSATNQLVTEVFAKHFHNEILNRMEDSAVVSSSERIAISTDSFVVTPRFFPGGDIGKLAICGTVNDLLMSGAIPKYLTCGFIIEEGALIEELDLIAASMAREANASGIILVAGDTKVIEGNGGIYINTTGVGFVPSDRELSVASIEEEDVILLSGTLGEHHATILSSRMNIKNTISSDCRVLKEGVEALFDAKIQIKAMRDVTRGGLGTILNEFSVGSNKGIEIMEEILPISEQVQGFCSILGLNPLYMGNEGKFIAVIPREQAELAIKTLQQIEGYEEATIIGKVVPRAGVRMITKLGGVVRVDVLQGEGLPRIC